MDDFRKAAETAEEVVAKSKPEAPLPGLKPLLTIVLGTPYLTNS